jgi:hypothetical protein
MTRLSALLDRRRRAICTEFALLVTILGGANLALADDKGKWTQPEYWGEHPDGPVNAGTYAVHLMLLRGDGNPDHSRILYYVAQNHAQAAQPAPYFAGRERGWNPGNDYCSDTTGLASCSAAPTAIPMPGTTCSAAGTCR